MKEIKNVKEFEEIKGTAIVDFNATWCGPCRMLKPILEKLDNEYDIPFYSVDVDDVEDLAYKFNVSSIPCVIYLENGEEKDRFVGFIPENKIKSFIENNK